MLVGVVVLVGSMWGVGALIDGLVSFLLVLVAFGFMFGFGIVVVMILGWLW